MSVRTDQVNLFVNVNSNKAQNELNDLRKKAGDVKAEMDGLKKGTEAYAAKKKELAEITASMDKLKQEIGLTALSQKELVAELNKLKALRGSVVPFSEEFKQLTKQIEAVDARLYDVKNGVQGFSSFLSKIKDEVKQFGVMAAAYLGFEFITDQFQSMLQGSGKLSDQLADVRKATGLTVEEVDGMNKSIKSIDTRTANGQLRDLAIQAGKLGVQGKQDIMDFVEAGDQINVALGEDLGEGAVEDLGKLVDIFRLKEDFGLKDSMLKVGSAINDVGASSAASEGYIVDFLKRMGGIGPAAKVSLPDLVGLAGTLDSLGQTSESSSTAIGNTLSKLVTDFDGFAKIAGKSGAELKKIFDEQGGLAALKTVLQGVKESGGNFDELVTRLGDVGIEGAKAKAVFAILTNNLDMLSGQQKIANDSFQQGISLTNEFNIKNQTFGATLDKLGKEFNSLLTSPAVTGFLESAVNGTVKFIQVLKDLPRFLADNRTAIIFLTGMVLSYVAAKRKAALETLLFNAQVLLETIQLKASAAWTAITTTASKAYAIAKGILTGQITLATVAQRLWNLAMKANPIGLVLAGITLLITAISSLTHKVSAETAAEQTRNDIRKRAVDAYAEEEAKIRTLTAVVSDHALSLDARKKALQDLIAINPQYLSGLTLENIATAQGKKLLDDYIQSLHKKAEMEAANALSAELVAKRTKLEFDKKQNEASIQKGGSGFGVDEATTKGILKANNIGIDKQLADIDQQMTVIDEFVKDKFAAVAKTADAGGKKVAEQTGQATTRSIASIKAQIKSLDDAYEGLDISQKKALQANRAQRQRLQEELDALEGKAPKQSKAQRKEESDYDRLKKEAAQFAKDLEKLRQEVARGDMDENDREIQRVKDKYAELSAKALQYYSKHVTDKKIFDAQEVELEKLKQQEISQLLNKFFEKRTGEEYEQSLANSGEYFEDLKQQTAKAYGDGLIDKKHYEDALKDIEHRESANRILIAQDYSGNVKKAAEDVRKFRLQQEKQTTAEAIAENEKRKEYTDAEKLSRARLGVINSRPGSDDRLKAQQNLLQVQFELETQYMDKTSAMYLEKEAELQQALAALRKQAQQEKIDRAMEYVGYFEQSLQGINQLVANSEAKQLARDKKKTEADKKTLKNQYDNKLISQAQYDKKVAALDEEQERKEKAVAHRQAEREKALNLFNAITGNAAAIVKTMSSMPFPLNVPLAIAQGIAGGLQIAAIANTPLPELGKGDWVRDGDKHSDPSGGIPVMIERDEAVMNANTMTDKNVYNVTGTPAQITSALNKQGGGVDWSGGAVIKQMPQWRAQPPATINSSMPKIMGQGGVVRQMAQASTYSASDNSAEFAELKAEMQGFREDIKTWNTSLKVYNVIKEQDDVRKLYQDAKKAGGLNQ